MAQFNEKEHLQNTIALAEELSKLLKNAAIITHEGFKATGDLTEMAKNLMAGKRSPLLTLDDSESAKQGKYLLLYDEQKPRLHFIEKQQQLQIPQSLSPLITSEDMENLQKFGTMNRIIYVDEKGIATPKYIALDKETNTLATMNANRLSISDTILGVSLTDSQKEQLRQGSPIILKGLQSKDGTESWDAVVSVDALSRGLSFKKIDLSIPKEILGVSISPEQQQALKNGESVLIQDMISAKTGNVFSAQVSLTDGHLQIKPTPDAPKILLGVSLNNEQRDILRKGEPLYIEGMTSKAGKPFNAVVFLDSQKGLQFDFKNKKEAISIKPEQELSIPVLDESAYGGRLKKTPSVALSKEKIIKNAVEQTSQKNETKQKNRGH
ncbi:DUF3945 domain-containing protein [Arcicella sp. LKC2W]|uniref:DUF3945 domain-containing protein n=1 Tax=Arcicella sp. LKC2W TaxID=2984198 RepID=UPI002B2101FD|nr:DUF3945 domain-containing protein [Arcicella sp. LKC2W]MEA5461644.1 DUF3945 domain-containing protein [Arcicella sp. LKC2W]